MTNDNDKSGSDLPPTKTFTQSIHNSPLHERLAVLNQELDTLLNSQGLYHEAILALLQSTDIQPETRIAGAIAIHQWLDESGQLLLEQFKDCQTG